jgi:hypothetical protein
MPAATSSPFVPVTGGWNLASVRPLSANDLQGSKMLINFCDSAFAIGKSSNDKDLRYLKQIKQRSKEYWSKKKLLKTANGIINQLF